MAATKEQLNDHIFRLVSVIRNAASNRSLEDYKSQFKQSYWIIIFNNFLDMAVLEWCKVFGTHSEPTHWKKIVEDHESFRKGLLGRLAMDEGGWKAYWEELKNYRDSQVAHHFRNPDVTHYPTLDAALEACYYYYEWLIANWRGLGNNGYPDDLRDYYSRYLDQAKSFSHNAFITTKHIEEKVY